jgi:hypothetical protein
MNSGAVSGAVCGLGIGCKHFEIIESHICPIKISVWFLTALTLET